MTIVPRISTITIGLASSHGGLLTILQLISSQLLKSYARQEALRNKTTDCLAWYKSRKCPIFSKVVRIDKRRGDVDTCSKLRLQRSLCRACAKSCAADRASATLAASRIWSDTKAWVANGDHSASKSKVLARQTSRVSICIPS